MKVGQTVQKEYFQYIRGHKNYIQVWSKAPGAYLVAILYGPTIDFRSPYFGRSEILEILEVQALVNPED